MQITDRAKDVIKSGGEWISSIDLENLAVGHPKVAEAAVIGVQPSEMGRAAAAGRRAQEGPDGDPARRSSRFMRGKIAKWWMPDDVVFVDEIPHTATGKIQKTALRERFKDYVLPRRGGVAVAPASARRLISARMQPPAAASPPRCGGG